MFHRFRQDDGAVAVELAIIAPLMIMMIAGIIYFGHFFAIANSLQQLAAETARASVRGLDTNERCQLARNFLTQNVSRYSFLQGDRISGNINPVSCDPGALTSGQTPAINVVLTYDLRGTLISLGNQAFSSDTESLTRSSYLAY